MNRHDPPIEASIDQGDPRRIIIRGPNPVVVTAAAAEWVAEWGSQIPTVDMAWHSSAG